MMKVRIGMDEWWPVYSIDEDDDYGPVIDLSEGEMMDYKRMMAQFNKWQRRFGKAFREWEDAGRP